MWLLSLDPFEDYGESLIMMSLRARSDDESWTEKIFVSVENK
jgi:hypothetical protein